MDVALLGARLLLAAVFAVAGLAKLLDRTGSRQAPIDFGVPARLAAPIGLGLPIAELTVAIALVPIATAWWGAVGALALLLLFVGGIGVALARGRAPTCRCFGQLGAGPVGRSTLVRNGLLAAVAGFVVWQGRVDPGPSVAGWLGDLTTAERAIVVVAAIGLCLLAGMALLLFQVIGQQGRLLLRIEALEQWLAAGGALGVPAPPGTVLAAEAGLPVGAPAPAFRLPDLRGEEQSLDGLLDAEKPVLLVFVDPDCGPCTTLMPDVGHWQGEHATRMSIAVVSRGTVAANRAKAAEHGVTTVLLQRDYEVADAYRVAGTPGAVLVRAGGTIGSPLAGGVEQIRSLVAHTVAAPGAQPWAALPALPMVPGFGHADPRGHQHGHATSAAPTIGDPAPTLALPDLTGTLIDLADARDAPTLVLFWNPDCDFCRLMLPELLAWEADPPPGAPGLVVVSAGSGEANRAMALRATVVLDQEFELGMAFGATATPSAVLLDAEGRIASDVAVGAPAILALIGAGSFRAAPVHARASGEGS